MTRIDRTGMTEPLTTGQQIVAWWETSTSVSEPADLADRIDAEIDRLRDRLHDEASLAEDRKLEIERLRAALKTTAEALHKQNEENERLRAALREIADGGHPGPSATAVAQEALGDE